MYLNMAGKPNIVLSLVLDKIESRDSNGYIQELDPNSGRLHLV